MADLMRMLENYSRQTKQQEDKISVIKQQEESLIKDLEGVRAINADKKRVLAETQARCGEVLSDLQQKRATLAESQAANEKTKQVISRTQDQREQLWEQLQQMREEFIAACATLENETCNTLGHLRACIGAAGADRIAEAAVKLDNGLQPHPVGDPEVV